jgi:hypothetical protein
MPIVYKPDLSHQPSSQVDALTSNLINNIINRTLLPDNLSVSSETLLNAIPVPAEPVNDSTHDVQTLNYDQSHSVHD